MPAAPTLQPNAAPRPPAASGDDGPISPAWQSPRAIGFVLMAFALLLSADLVSKRVAFDQLVISQRGTPPQRVVIESREVRFVPGWLHFTATANQGAVFGLGQGKRWLFVTVSVVALGFLGYLFATTDRRQWPAHLLLAMFLAGVVGNMYDRLAFGFVRDMLFALPGFSWPGTWQIPVLGYPDRADRHVFPWVFNLADSYLCVGVAVVLLHALWPVGRGAGRSAGVSAGA